jgi:crotonobetainyl-CoA:carnitine CoA-transferase CaiB-like acyl-CoA transferase
VGAASYALDRDVCTHRWHQEVAVDLRQPLELDTLKRLVREADVFSQGYRPGTSSNRGLSPEELAPPRLCASLSAFSHKALGYISHSGPSD